MPLDLTDVFIFATHFSTIFSVGISLDLQARSDVLSSISFFTKCPFIDDATEYD